MGKLLLHTRKTEAFGSRLDNGDYELIGIMQDCKNYSFSNEMQGKIPKNNPYHDIHIKLIVDKDFFIKDIEGDLKKTPFIMCPKIVKNYKSLIGIKIGKNWRLHIKNSVGAIKGCTHLTELLQYMGTVAFQTIYTDLNKNKKKDINNTKISIKGILNTCHSWGENSPVVKKILEEK